ncbi:uncharacterized protein [Spinacia oleracea]|uniref:Peptidase A2 domain-containing protein n=1 Tax=Spinacia oleracea TaxID=3562 RepID=A0ABM3RPY2_SPIOL|nr:uncharacterized protein LOC130471522 [Spinacia oleracea]
MEVRSLTEESYHAREEHLGRLANLAQQRRASKPQARHFTSRSTTMTSGRPRAELTRRETDRGVEVRGKRRRPSIGSLFVYNAALEDILLAERQNLGIEQWSPKGPSSARQGIPFCIFHKDAGHSTQNCRMLKRIFDDANEVGHIKGQETCTSPTSDNDGSHSDEGFIAVISGGIAAGAPTSEGRQFSSSPLHTKQLDLPRVEISEDDYRKSAMPYDDDPLVLEIKVANLRVKRVLVDTGSSSDIISLQCLQKLQHDPGTIERVSKPLVGFGGSVVRPIGFILLPVSIGTPPVTKEGIVRFIIVASLTSFNIILGRPALNDLKAVIVPHLLLIKFVGSSGDIGAIYGNQQLARIATCLHWNRRPGERPREGVNR